MGKLPEQRDQEHCAAQNAEANHPYFQPVCIKQKTLFVYGNRTSRMTGQVQITGQGRKQMKEPLSGETTSEHSRSLIFIYI
jgi:hypothetical protein